MCKDGAVSTRTTQSGLERGMCKDGAVSAVHCEVVFPRSIRVFDRKHDQILDTNTYKKRNRSNTQTHNKNNTVLVRKEHV